MKSFDSVKYELREAILAERISINSTIYDLRDEWRLKFKNRSLPKKFLTISYWDNPNYLKKDPIVERLWGFAFFGMKLDN